MGLSPVELRALHEVIQRMLDVEDKVNLGVVGVATVAQYLRSLRQSVQAIIDHAEKPITTGGGVCGWCHEYVSQERNLFKHVQACRNKMTAEQRIAWFAAAEGLTKLAKDLETK